MSGNLIQDINNYITFLNNSGLSVSVHGRQISGLLKHNIHRNPFCMFVKTSDEAWGKCIRCQQKIYSKSDEDFFFGMCYAGLEEYVFKVDDNTFISVSGYGINREKSAERINRISKNFFLNKEDLFAFYDRGLKHEPEDEDALKARIYPLCHMIRLSLLQQRRTSEIQSNNRTFDSILAYIQGNIMRDISLKDIADACACSESTVSHLFKKYANQPVKKYIRNLRINQAKVLLSASDVPVTNVALLCGFSDVNYFSTVFKKDTGLAPTAYRELKKDE